MFLSKVRICYPEFSILVQYVPDDIATVIWTSKNHTIHEFPWARDEITI